MARHYDKYKSIHISLQSGTGMPAAADGMLAAVENIIAGIQNIQSQIMSSQWQGKGKEYFSGNTYADLENSNKSLRDKICNLLKTACDKSIKELLPKLDEMVIKEKELEDKIKTLTNAINTKNNTDQYETIQYTVIELGKEVKKSRQVETEAWRKACSAVTNAEEAKAIVEKELDVINEVAAKLVVAILGLNGGGADIASVQAAFLKPIEDGEIAANPLEMLLKTIPIEPEVGIPLGYNKLLPTGDYSKYVYGDNPITITSEEQLRNLGPGKHKVKFKIGGKVFEGDILIPPNPKNKGLLVALTGDGNGFVSTSISNGSMPMPDKIVFSPYYGASKAYGGSYAQFTTEDLHQKVAFIENAFGLDSSNKTIIGFSVGAQKLKKTVENHSDEWRNIILLDSGFKASRGSKYWTPKPTVLPSGKDYSNVHVFVGSGTGHDSGSSTYDAAYATGTLLNIIANGQHNWNLLTQDEKLSNLLLYSVPVINNA